MAQQNQESLLVELARSIETTSASLVHLRRIKSSKEDIDSKVGELVALKSKYKDINNGTPFQKVSQKVQKTMKGTIPKSRKKTANHEQDEPDVVTQATMKDRLPGLEASVDFFNNLSSDDFDSPICRSLRLALRPFFLKMTEKERDDGDRHDYALKRAIQKETEGLTAKRRAKDKR